MILGYVLFTPFKEIILPNIKTKDMLYFHIEDIRKLKTQETDNSNVNFLFATLLHLIAFFSPITCLVPSCPH